MPRRSVMVVVAAAVLVAAGAWALRLPAGPPADPAVVPALARTALALRTDDPAAADDDLRPLLPILAGRRVVALGEATHGTREFFRLKDRIVRLLVRHAGVTTFALEISSEAAARMDTFVRGGPQDADEALRRFEFWTWQTEEVRDLARWLQEWNRDAPDDRRVSFVGINATGADRDHRLLHRATPAGARRLARGAPTRARYRRDVLRPTVRRALVQPARVVARPVRWRRLRAIDDARARGLFDRE